MIEAQAVKALIPELEATRSGPLAAALSYAKKATRIIGNALDLLPKDTVTAPKPHHKPHTHPALLHRSFSRVRVLPCDQNVQPSGLNSLPSDA